MNTNALIANKVGIMISTRWIRYPNIGRFPGAAGASPDY